MAKDERSAERLFQGPGEARALCRAMDWAKTPLGAVEGWPNSLRSTVATLLASPQPMLLLWGVEGVQLYNDAYRVRLQRGEGCLRSLGVPARQAGSQLWEALNPDVQAAMGQGTTAWYENRLLVLDRLGGREESYWTYGVSPVRGDDGQVAGVLVVSQETTERVLFERRLYVRHRLLDLRPREGVLATAREAMRMLSLDAYDVPFALCFLPQAGGEGWELAGATGVVADSLPAGMGQWPLDAVVHSGSSRLCPLPPGWDSLCFAPWEEAPPCALALPLSASQEGESEGVLIVGLSARLPLDEAYDLFLHGVARDIAVRLAASGVEEDRQRLAAEREALIRQLDAGRGRLAEVFQQAPAFMATVRGPEHRFEMANPVYYQLVGHRELLGRTVREALPEMEEQGFLALLDGVYRTGEPFVANEMKILLQREQDLPMEERYVNFVYQPLREQDGSISGILAHGVDVTEMVQTRGQREHLLEEQVRTRGKLERAESHYRRLVTTASLPIYVLDGRGRIQEVNPAGEQLLGRPSKSLVGEPFRSVVAPESSPAMTSAFYALLSGRVLERELEFQIVRPSGQRRLVQATAVPIVEEGRVVGVHGIVRDVTEERAAAEAVRESEERFRQMAETIREVFWMSDLRTSQILYVSPACEEIWGHPAQEFLDDPSFFWKYIHPEDIQKLVEGVEEVRRGGLSTVECRIRRPDGEVRWLSIKSFPVCEEDGSPSRMVGVTEDITERKQAESALQESQRILSTLMDSLPGMAYRCYNSLDWEMEFVSEGSLKLTGYSPTELERGGVMTFGRLIHPEDQDSVWRVTQEALAERRPFELTYRIRTRNGEEKWVWEQGRGVFSEAGELLTLEGLVLDVTDRKRAEAGLRESEERFRSAFEDAAVGMALVSLEGRSLRVNRALCEMLGYSEEEVLGQGPAGLTHPDDLAGDEALANRLLAGEIPCYQQERRYLRKDGSILWGLLNVSLVHGERGPLYFAAQIQDITRRKRAEAAALAESERLRQILRALPVGVILLDAEGRVVSGNPAAEGIWSELRQVGPEEYQQYRAWHLESREPVQAEQWAAVAALRGEPYTEQLLEIEAFDGRRKVVTNSAVPLRDAEGRVNGAVVVTREITEARRQEAQMRFLNMVMGRLPQGISILDENRRFVFMNEAASRLFGVEQERVEQYGLEDILPPHEEPEKVATIFRKIEDEGGWSGRLLRKRVSDGVLVPIDIQVHVLEGADGGKLHFNFFQEASEAIRNERQMQVLTTVLERVEQGVVVLDEKERFLFMNAAAGRLLGADPAEAVSFRPDDFLVPGEEPDAAMGVHRMREMGHWSGRVRRRRRDDGTVVPMDMVVSVAQGPDGRTLYFKIFQDARESLERERQLLRAERLASVGTLISGVAHELNNPLNAVLNFTQFLLLSPERPPEEREDLETIQRETERMAKIVADLRQVARQTQEVEPEMAPVDLNEVVRHVLRTRDYSLRTHNVEVRQDLAAEPAMVEGDRSQLEQVVLNLVVNAEQSMQEVIGARRLVVRTRISPREVSLYVVDSGPGVPRHLLERIFDPFFTTKAPGQGTGLGLSLVSSIVTAHRGQIHVDSEAGRGSTFRVELPTAARGGLLGVEPQASKQDVRPRLRILVVDDEEPLRVVSARYLASRGHEVQMAAEGREALRLLAEAGKPYDVILSDLRMPGMGGDELLAELRRQGRGMERRLVFMTGDVASPEAVRVLSEANVPTLTKPVGLADLSRVVEELAVQAR